MPPRLCLCRVRDDLPSPVDLSNSELIQPSFILYNRIPSPFTRVHLSTPAPPVLLELLLPLPHRYSVLWVPTPSTIMEQVQFTSKEVLVRILANMQSAVLQCKWDPASGTWRRAVLAIPATGHWKIPATYFFEAAYLVRTHDYLVPPTVWVVTPSAPPGVLIGAKMPTHPDPDAARPPARPPTNPDPDPVRPYAPPTHPYPYLGKRFRACSASSQPQLQGNERFAWLSS